MKFPNFTPLFRPMRQNFPGFIVSNLTTFWTEKNGANYENYENYEIRGYFSKYVTAGLLQESARNSNSS